MRRSYQLPTDIACDDLPESQRLRLAAVVLDAVARAVRATARADGAVVTVPGRPPAREAFAGLRVAADGRTYATPSYDAGGRPVALPLRPGASFPFRVRLSRRLNSDELLREFVRQYRRVAGAAQAERLLGAEHWRWTGKPPEVTDTDVALHYKVLHVIDHSLRAVHAAQEAVNEQALAALDAAQRDALNAEADRRFRAATGGTGKLGTPAEDPELVAYWLAVRDGLLRERREIDALPPRIREFLFTTGAQRAAGPADYAAVLRLARKLSALSDADLAGYQAMAETRTTDWDLFEASVDRYLAEVTRFRNAGVAVESAKSALYAMDRLYELHKMWQALGGMSGTYPAVDESRARRIDAEFRAELAAQRLASPAAFEALIADFLAAFESKTVLIGLDVLARYDHLLRMEQQRFQAPGAAEDLATALSGTRAKSLYAEAAEKAGTAGGIGPDPELHRYVGAEYALKTRLESEAAQAKAAADKLVTAAAGTLAAEEGFDRAALARAGSADAVLQVVRNYVAEHRRAIAETHAHLTHDRAYVYDLPPLLQASMDQQDIRAGTLYHRIITDRISSLQARKIAKGIVLAVVTIAIGLATGGTGLLGAALVSGLSAWQVIDAYQEYARGHAAQQAGLLDDDPWFGWVVVAAAGAAIDFAGLAKAISPAEKALKNFKTTLDVDRLAVELKAANLADRLAASIVTQARGAARLDAALRSAGAVIGRANTGLAILEGFGAAVWTVYLAARQGIVSLDRFVLQLRAARLIAEGELSAEQLVRLRAAFEQAGAAGTRLRRLGTELGLTEDRVAAVVESWGANPAWTLAEVEGRMRVAAAGDARAAFRQVLAARPVLDRELSTLERSMAAAGRLNPADAAQLDELTARLSRLHEIDRISVAPRTARIVEVSLDEAAPNYWKTVASVVPGPPVVLEFPNGTRVWRDTVGGPVSHESTLAGSLGRRADFERAIYSAGEHGNLPPGPRYQRAHVLGQGTGFESPYAILYAPEYVNQTLQNNGIEAYLESVVAGARSDETFRVFAKTRPHPDALRLAEIEYSLVRVNPAGTEEIATYTITVSSSAEHPVVTATSLRFAPTSTAREVATRFRIPPQLTSPARFAY